MEQSYLKELITEYLNDEYSYDEIEVMLNDAVAERINNTVYITYKNGIKEILTVKRKEFLVIQEFKNNQ